MEVSGAPMDPVSFGLGWCMNKAIDGIARTVYAPQEEDRYILVESPKKEIPEEDVPPEIRENLKRVLSMRRAT